jgi:general L-amino acid transport system permease protein
MAGEAEINTRPPAVSPINNPRVRSLAIQAALLLLVVGLGWWFLQNARANLAARGIATGFEFFDQTAGFGITQSLIAYSETSTYGRAFLVGLLNTLLVSGIGIVLATVIGFAVGVARLSSNFLLSRIAGAYVELLRNLPLLFQIFFWYIAVLGTLPGPRQSVSIPGGIYLNNRGVIVPEPVLREGAEAVGLAILIGIAGAIAISIWARWRQAATGKQFRTGLAALALVIGLPLIVYAATGAPISFVRPELRGFNFVGGVRVIPEFAALLVALSTYTAAFIAEIVRAGITAVSRGQTEAAYSLGIRPGPTLRLIVVPQAMRVIIPPLTSQYLNLTKNSSLAAGIGYPDFFYVFAGTTLNQTGQAIEIIAITMAVYLFISLVTSAAMNWYNRRKALVER